MKLSTKETTVNIAYSGLFTAIICILSQIALPMPSGVSLTFQTFAVSLCGFLLGVKWGTASIIVYILLGAVGAPVFTGFCGGVQVLFGLSGGFIFGFLPLSALCGVSLFAKKTVVKLIFGILGLIICHIIGAVQFSVIYGYSFFTSLLTVSAPFILKDIISVATALYVSLYIKKLIRRK